MLASKVVLQPASQGWDICVNTPEGHLLWFSPTFTPLSQVKCAINQRLMGCGGAGLVAVNVIASWLLAEGQCSWNPLTTCPSASYLSKFGYYFLYYFVLLHKDFQSKSFVIILVGS